MRIVIACALAMTLAACADYELRQQEQAQAQAAAQSASDDAQCQSYGAPPGSPLYVQCRMNLDNQRASMRHGRVTARCIQALGRAPVGVGPLNTGIEMSPRTADAGSDKCQHPLDCRFV
jgi:hypothetical protein